MALVSLASTQPAAAAGLTLSCEAAAQVAEAETGLPTGLLAAIGQVEAGRRVTVGGPALIWPWTVNASGRGSFLSDAMGAVSFVNALLGQGVHSIDVGCFQVNLGFHPNAFASVVEAFDPVANARYAARFLIALHRDTGDWGDAIARYHSATQELGVPYRTLVFAAWSGADPTTMRVSMPATGDPVVVRMSSEARGVHVYYGAIPMPSVSVLSKTR